MMGKSLVGEGVRSVVCGDGLVEALDVDQSCVGVGDGVAFDGLRKGKCAVLSYTEDSGTVESCYLLVGVSRLAGPHGLETLDGFWACPLREVPDGL